MGNRYCIISLLPKKIHQQTSNAKDWGSLQTNNIPGSTKCSEVGEPVNLKTIDKRVQKEDATMDPNNLIFVEWSFATSAEQNYDLN